MHGPLAGGRGALRSPAHVSTGLFRKLRWETSSHFISHYQPYFERRGAPGGAGLHTGDAVGTEHLGDHRRHQARCCSPSRHSALLALACCQPPRDF